MGILLAASRTYLSTLRELGDVRIAYIRAQQLDQLKDQFIAHINHELRSPVMALQGHVELLLLAEDNLSPQERHSYLERAKHAGDDLVSLVTSILAVRRLEQQVDAFSPERISVGEIVESAIRLLDPREGQQIERDLHLTVPRELHVWAEPVRMRQILTNLLSNAVKYSPSGTPVEVTAAVMLDKPDTTKRRQRQESQLRQVVQITVRDYGYGIPPDQIPLLFKRFVRLPRDLASNVPGNGLGLYLSRTLAEAMGGTLWVESTGIEGEGSAFHLRLPVPPLAEGGSTTGA
jgi:signal transduction histidine kinase